MFDRETPSDTAPGRAAPGPPAKARAGTFSDRPAEEAEPTSRRPTPAELEAAHREPRWRRSRRLRDAAAVDPHGRAAERPSEIPPRGWRDVLRRVRTELTNDNIDLIAAGVAFYAMSALPPALASLVSIYGLVLEPGDLADQLDALARRLPPGAYDVVSEQLRSLVNAGDTALGVSFVVSLLIALWSATKGTKAIITACNVAYDEEERRGFLALNALAIGMTLGLILFLCLSLALVAVLPAVLEYVGLGGWARIAVDLVRWPLLVVLVLTSQSALYRWAPCRNPPKWRWVTWGSGLATALWVLASAGFSMYVSNFGKYDETYGSLGAIMVLLIWLYITAYVMILGAELNAEMEHQTAKDSTEGAPKPMGARGAYVADTLGR